MALSDTTVRQARITGSDYSLGDTDGLQNRPGSPACYQPFLDASVQLNSTPSIQRWAGANSG